MERIQKYLHGELSDKERREFEAELSQDADLAAEVDAAKILLAQFQVEKKKHWQQLLAQSEEKPTVKIKPLRSRRGQIIRAIAAAVVIGLLGLFSYQYFSSVPSLESQVAEYLEERHLPPTTLMGEPSTEILWQQTKEAYSTGDWVTAISSIESIRASTTLTAEQHFYLGLSNLYKEPGDYDQAIDNFKLSRQLGAAQYGQQADWYESLALLAKEDFAEAKILLERIVEDKQWQAEKAQKLLQKLH